jgi:hypothetical protein
MLDVTPAREAEPVPTDAAVFRRQPRDVDGDPPRPVPGDPEADLR